MSESFQNKFILNPLLEPTVKALEKTKDPIKQALAALLRNVDAHNQRFDFQDTKLLEIEGKASEIETQTKLTNGRVTTLEGKVKVLELIPQFFATNWKVLCGSFAAAAALVSIYYALKDHHIWFG
jgi:hypothetical protein